MTLFLTSAAALTLAAVTPPTTVPGNTAQLSQAIDRLAVVGNVLYVAAHPDDENTELLSWLIHEKKIRAAYLSLTRGEGGQNLLGAERAPLLGVIRTQELLAARHTDGAEQFFGRERDFGFSKSPDETLTTWGKEEALSDVVWVIRRFQPDVIVTRFSPLPAKTHGHHTASAMLALEAFKAAADPAQFPEQLQWVKPWQAKRIVWNKGTFQGVPTTSDFLALDIGTYNRRLGVSMGEIAAASRSMHKSQGFGEAPERGSELDYFKLLDGAPMAQSLLDGVDFTWARVSGSDKLREQLRLLRSEFNPDHPETSLTRLLASRDLIAALPENPWKAHKLAEIDEVMAAVAGIFASATSATATTVPGGALTVSLEVVQRALPSLTLRAVKVGGEALALGKALTPSQVFQQDQVAHAPLTLANPYWLREREVGGLFTVNDPTVRGLPEAPPALSATFVFSVGDHTLELTRPVQYVWTDPVGGERQRPLEILPEVTVDAAAPVMMFPDVHSKTLTLRVRATAAAAKGALAAHAPAGFAITPASADFALAHAGEEALLTFSVTPTVKLGNEDDSASGVVSFSVGGSPAHGVTRIDYPHIPVQTLTPPTAVKLVRFTQKRALTYVGYVNGAGDDVAAALRDVGYDVTVLTDAALASGKLEAYEAIVIGVRAFNTNPRMLEHVARLQAYVHNGGIVLTQYNTQNWISSVKGEMGPYPIALSADRVTEENAEVTFALPEHPVLRAPNHITPHDFDGWVQERGLYFAGAWDKRYATPLSMHDQKEEPKLGSLLVAHHGKGVFIYTGLAFFRQLPAGVPGAYRLMANLLSRGK